MTEIPQLELAAQAAGEWVDDLVRRLGWHDREKACLALVATLHALRDNLPPPEAVFLGEYLPPLIRGFYYGGWHMTRTPRESKSRDGFLERIRNGVHHDPGVDAEAVGHAVFALLAAHVPAEEIEDVKAASPKELRGFWPQ